jgi:hypothetical protein
LGGSKVPLSARAFGKQTGTFRRKLDTDGAARVKRETVAPLNPDLSSFCARYTINSLRLFLLIAALLIAPMCRASLIGTSVTGVLSGVPFIENFWDPANGLVPSTGFQNSSSNQDSATVTIVGGNEFGLTNGGPDISFSSTGFMFTKDLPVQFVAFGGYQITLTDASFESVDLISNTFTGLTYGISGDVITINTPLINVPPYDYSASFSVNAPEPSSWALVALGAVGLVWRRKSLSLG